MRKPVRDIGAPVRVCRLNLAKERHQPFDLLLTRFAHQRFLYRLSISRHRQRFVLKGAMLMTRDVLGRVRASSGRPAFGCAAFFGPKCHGGLIDINSPLPWSKT
jgi:hypothetical protein